MVMESRDMSEIYGYEARVQLSFTSSMKIASIICCTFAIVVTIFLRTIVITTTEPGVSESTLNTWMAGYMLIGFFLASFISSAISFPIYSFICSKQKGQRVTGRFAVLVSSSNKSLKQDK